MMLVVLAAGCAVLVPAVAADGGPNLPGRSAAGLAVLAGCGYVLGMGGLYRAFSLAPARVVAPILGAYPMLSLALAAAEGRAVRASEALAVAAIMGGIAVVSRATTDQGTGREAPGQALVWAAAGALGFAATFHLGQAASLRSDPFTATLISRLAALAILTPLWLPARRPLPQEQRKTLILMGALDALALTCISAAAGLPHPEYASISSSLFGVLTILLAWRFLGERVNLRQGFGVLLVFSGIGILAASG